MNHCCSEMEDVGTPHPAAGQHTVSHHLKRLFGDNGSNKA